MTKELYKSPEKYHQRPMLRANIGRVLRGLNKSGILTRQLEITGQENLVCLDKPAIIAPNHRSMADTILDGLIVDEATDLPVFFAAKENLWKYKSIGKLFEAVGAFPVNRQGGGLEHFMKVGQYVLEHDSHLIVYPEGTRNLTEIIDTKIGAAVLGATVGVPIIPLGQYGTEDMYNPMKRKPVTVAIGEPLYPDEKIREESLELGNSERRSTYHVARELDARLNVGLQAAFDEALLRYEELTF